jgi:hypothetical protein
MNRPPVSLARKQVSHDTVEACRTLLRQAEKGELIGLAWAGMYDDRTFDTDTAGEAYINRRWACAMLESLIFRLRSEIYRDETT